MTRSFTRLGQSLLLWTVTLLLAACPMPPATPTTGTVPPATPDPAATTPAVDVTEADLAELETLLADSLGLTISPTTTLGIAGVRAISLTNTLDDARYWAAYTYGLRNFDPLQSHALAIYTRAGGSWQEITQVLLDEVADSEGSSPAPDFVGEGSVTQEQIEPSHLWLQVQGGAGAHSGVYSLFSFDGATLQLQSVGFSASPGASHLQDLNNDGTPEVLLDATDYYVFCYACGVRLIQYSVMRWDGAQMVPLTLTSLGSEAPAELQTLNEQLLQLAKAGLWQDVLATLDANSPLPTDDTTFTWNVAYLRLVGEDRRAEAATAQAYPLLSHLFYGDYAAAEAIFSDAGADAVFIPNSPVIQGTVAEGWEPTLADWILGAVEPALALQPDLAPAHFLRGWAAYLKTGEAAAALADLQQAAELAPDDLFYNKSVDFLGG